MNSITTKADWDKALDAVSSYDFYHTYDYHKVSAAQNELPLLLEYTDGEQKIYIPLIKRPIPNTPYFDITSAYGYVGPVYNNTISPNFDNFNFAKHLKAFFQDENIIAVFSRLNPFIASQDLILKDIGDINNLGDIVTLDLTQSLDVQRSLFSKTTKRHINKCRKLFDVYSSTSESDIAEFIALYYENMERVNANKNYFFSEAYFFNILKNSKAEIDILFARDKIDNTVVSAAMMLKTNRIIQYHISGTKTDFLNVSPVKLLIDEMRIKGTEEGFHLFNLGGGLGNKEDSLFHFKASFSKTFNPFKVWKYVVNQAIYDKLVASRASQIDLNSKYFPLYRL